MSRKYLIAALSLPLFALSACDTGSDGDSSSPPAEVEVTEEGPQNGEGSMDEMKKEAEEGLEQLQEEAEEGMENLKQEVEEGMEQLEGEVEEVVEETEPPAPN
ncbi:MAG: hypothetical protein MI755_20920 [Sphingomonadales bacterium]|nr:hypothetical protein [Sphingomonadales bacterium]